MGKQKNIVTREILFLAMWFMDQKVFLFWCRTDIRDEPARLDPARLWRFLTEYFSTVWKDISLKLFHNIVIDHRIFVSCFYRNFLISSELIEFFAITYFCQFSCIFAYNSRTTEYFQNLIYLTSKNVWRPIRNTIGFSFENKFYKV